MRAVEAKATITEDGRLTVRVPPDIPPGEHRVKVIFEDEPATIGSPLGSDFPLIHVDAWPEDLSLRREDMYDDWGR